MLQESVHCADKPVVDEYFPAAQSSQETAPSKAYVPAPHVTHVLCDERAWYWPETHGTQLPPPDDGWLRPLLHGVHAVAPAVEYWPRVHVKGQLANPVALEKRPASQFTQLMAPVADEYVPALHDEQELWAGDG